MECERRCSSPRHERACPCQGCNGVRIGNVCRQATDDHFTARAILKISKINDSKANHQWLSVPCHRAKDADTPLRAEVLRMERKGHILTFAQHRVIFERGKI